MLKIIVMGIGMPIWCVGWILGLLSRPLWGGWVDGFNWIVVRTAEDLQVEIARRRIAQEQSEADNTEDPFSEEGGPND